MARQPRIDFPGGLYHVISRGIERRRLFVDDADRNRYLGLLEKSVARFGCRLYAYCLMDNHVHLAIEVGKRPLSAIMRSINTAYAGYFNLRHRRSGYLFQGRYKAFLVDQEAYLLSLIRYIHENPVAAGLAPSAEGYRWSSHQSYLGRSPGWLAADEILERFGTRRTTAIRAFCRFFSEEEPEPYGSTRARNQIVVGNDFFAQKALEHLSGLREVSIKHLPADAVVTWISRREGVAPEDLSGPVRRRDLSRVRALCASVAPAVGVSIAGIAKRLGRNQANLWRSVRDLATAAESDTRLARILNRLRSDLIAHANNT